MGRWTQYDEDDYRLPEGMKRVGYDSDSGKYYYRGGDGRLWEGAEGAQYGELRQVGEASVPTAFEEHSDEDLEAAPSRGDGYQALATEAGTAPHRSRFGSFGNAQAYRTLFPFLMMVLVVLLLVLRLAAPSHHQEDPVMEMCSNYVHAYRVKPGDTCWDIANSRGFTVEELTKVNPGLNCDLLTPSQVVCLPEEKPTVARAGVARRT
ncbi:hypothetical protein EUX98_g7354 [Antrodiella citrinella]|uniref:LysM domain-containing protein n=1 Tax=Antrodiella citrinella TaxID=2447956 RepID=A0A4S4MLP5_9APHY|nr:hypothetical protein EUX98_g7354 [Antrodiella citrinella]